MENTPGPLVIIGGAEDMDGDRAILSEVVRLAGGQKARIAVITSASVDPSTAADEYIEAFLDLGCREVWPLKVNTRQHAHSRECHSILHRATGAFFTGGDQLRITGVLGGTPLYEILHEAHRKGTLIAGTSAGASVMSDTMIVEGLNDEAPRKCTTKMAPGMGFLKDTVIDQHFAQRGRLGRLLSAVAQNPHVLGLGIDEDTAVVVSPDSSFRVIGSRAVTVLDGHGIDHSNASEQAPEEPLAITSVILHILPVGYGFSLADRRTILPVKPQDGKDA